MNRAEAVGQLVERARHFDQNAMALLAQIRTNAAKGVPAAQESLRHWTAYVRTHPLLTDGSLSAFRVGCEPWVCPRSVRLANQEPLTPSRTQALLSACFGVDRSPDIPRIVERAVRLQALRQPDSSFSAYHPMLGWEFGEDITSN